MTVTSDDCDLLMHLILCVRFKLEGAAGAEISEKLFFSTLSGGALAGSKSLTLGIHPTHSLKGELENGGVSGTVVCAVDSTFALVLAACLAFVEEL